MKKIMKVGQAFQTEETTDVSASFVMANQKENPVKAFQFTEETIVMIDGQEIVAQVDDYLVDFLNGTMKVLTEASFDADFDIIP